LQLRFITDDEEGINKGTTEHHKNNIDYLIKSQILMYVKLKQHIDNNDSTCFSIDATGGYDKSFTCMFGCLASKCNTKRTCNGYV
jgi:hypothetical protein